MAETGWIKLHRKVLDCWIWQEKPFDKARAWVDLLLLAMHRDKKLLIDNEIFVVERGSFMTSIVKLSNRWGWSRCKVMRYLELLESEQMLNTKRTPKGTLVTIVKYEDYQIVDMSNDTPLDTTNNTTDDTTDDTPLDTTDDTQKKNIKNIKNDKNNNNYCSEPKENLASEPPVITLTLNDKTEYPISQTDVDEWKVLYPAVDVVQQLRYMKAWCDSNPSKRKTSRGIKRFITSWLMKEQDRGGGYSVQANNKPNGVLDKYLKGGK